MATNVTNMRYMDDLVQNLIDKVERLNSAISKVDGKIVVWGAGEHTDYLMKVLNVSVNSIYFCDNNPNLNYYIGKKIVRPYEIKWEEIALVIVSSFYQQESIIEELVNIYSYKGKYLRLYNETDNVPFYKYDLNKLKSQNVESYLGDKGRLSDEYIIKKIEDFCEEIEDKTKYSVQYVIFDKYKGIEEKPISFMDDYKDVAIIIQGAIKYEFDYTLNSIFFYKRIFPGAHVILSTSEKEKSNPELERYFGIDGVDVVFKPVMQNGGYGNIDRQLLTTYNGLKYVDDKLPYVKYALKTRTDQRITAPDAIAMLKSLLRDDGMHRIACCPYSRSVNYYFYDYVNFGKVKDMVTFWSPRSDEERIKDERFNTEPYLYGRYAFRGAGNIDYATVSEEEYKKSIKNNYAFFYLKDLCIHWPKYNHNLFGYNEVFQARKMDYFYPTEWKYI